MATIFKSLSKDEVNKGKYTLDKLLLDLDEMYPFRDGARWDNIGILVEGSAKYVIPEDNLFYSLDVTLAVLHQVPDEGILISHHPIIFSGMKNMNSTAANFNIIKEAMNRGITLIAMHTNYDEHFLNKYYTETILGIEDFRKSGSLLISKLKREKPLDFFLQKIRKSLPAGTPLKYVAESEKRLVSSLAICTGSGGSLLSEAKKEGVDLLLTGDISYHHAIDALSLEMSMIDITHFHSEKYFGIDLIEVFSQSKKHIIKQMDPFKEY